MPVMFRPLVRYADFLGRSRRSEFWPFYLLIFLVSAACVTGGVIVERTTQLPGNAIGFCLLNLVYLALALPFLAVMVRRLHDVDKSGWWLLVALIPFGVVVLITFLIREGVSGPNRFGPDPKAASVDNSQGEPGRCVPNSLP